MIKLLQWSDSHGYADAAQTAIRCAQSTPNLDFCIHTGDICNNVIEDGYSYAYPMSYGFTVGNHDALLRAGADPSGYKWSEYHPSQQQMYNTFFKGQPVLDMVNIAEPNTWWYKDISNVTVLGIDCTAQEPYATQEAAWVKQHIDRCISNKRNIIFASHYMPPVFTILNNNFTNYYSSTAHKSGIVENSMQYYPAIQKIYNEVVSGCNRGANIILWMCGHTHFDTCAVSQTSNVFPCIAMDCTLIYANIYAWNDTARSTSTTNPQNGCCNLYHIDNDYIRIYRLGSAYAVSGKIRNEIIWSIKEHKFVYTWSR